MTSSSTFIHVFLKEAYGLAAMDLSGQSDPYCRVQYGETVEKTDIIRKSLNPKWRRCFVFEVKEADEKSDAIDFTIFDYDVASADDIIGKTRILITSMWDIYNNENEPMIEGWFDLTKKKAKGIFQGAIKVLIAISPNEKFKFSRRSQHKAYKIVKNIAEVSKLNEINLQFDNPDEPEVFNALVVTWNVGNEAPPDTLKILQDRSHEFELIVIGVQECEYVTENDPETNDKVSCDNAWTKTIIKSVGDDYCIVTHQRLGEMKLTLLAKKQERTRLTRFQTGSVACGVGNVMANKGALGVAFHWDDTSICFINCHLAAHQGMVKERNENYQRICTNTKIGQGNLGFLHQYHYVVWMGDLNYRLDFGEQGKLKEPSSEDFNAIVDLIKAKEYEKLFEKDQLSKQIKEQVAWQEFKEGKSDFSPTFKVLKGENLTYDTKRSPAWCDRVLWKENKKQSLTQVFLKSDESINTSDHKPVYSHLQIPYCPIFENQLEDKESFKICFEELKGEGLRSLDVGGKSDPYLLVICPSLFYKDGRTVTQLKTLDPEWDDLFINVAANNPLMIKNQILIFKAMDYDGADHIDDLIGTQCLPLDDFVVIDKDGNLDESTATEFKVQLYFGKELAGLISGKIRIMAGVQEEEQIKEMKCCKLL